MKCRSCQKTFKPRPRPLREKFYCHPCGMLMSDIHGIKKRILDKAIKDKILEKPTKFKCVDCGSKAWCYDHRNYGKPLDVEPVCSGCNFNRGGAKTLKWIRNLARRINEQRKGI